MPCYLPIQAHRRGEAVAIGRPPPGQEALCLPCGKCVGCRTANAKEWALRCQLELHQHRYAVFTTLTYDDRWLPPTLEKKHLQKWLKRFRKAMGPKRPIRFFASGEYGEQTQRPHYHAILYGAHEADGDIIQDTWKMGHTRTYPVTIERIAYTAGYTSKKLEDALHSKHERVDPETGEVYYWQPPFLQMSRRPGIGGEARKHAQSWRAYAIHNGNKMAVPRFYHEAWKAQATEEQIQKLKEEKDQQRALRNITLQMLADREKHELSKQELRKAKRTL